MFVQKFMQDPAGNSLAVLVLIGMLASLVVGLVRFLNGSESSVKSRWPQWSVPVLAAIGLGISAYLTYVERTHVVAICGPIGNCNTVQTSSYAYFLGLIPVGLLGVAGYLLIGISWVINRSGSANTRKVTAIGMWGLAVIGILFSIYLTFLEPFVIGATCMWCIGSAVVMTLIFWATTGPALGAMAEPLDLADPLETLQE